MKNNISYPEKISFTNTQLLECIDAHFEKRQDEEPEDDEFTGFRTPPKETLSEKARKEKAKTDHRLKKE